MEQDNNKKTGKIEEERLNNLLRVIRWTFAALLVFLLVLKGIDFFSELSKEIKYKALQKIELKKHEMGEKAEYYAEHAWINGDSVSALYMFSEAAILTMEPIERNNYLGHMNTLWDRNELLKIFRNEEVIKDAEFNNDETKILIRSTKGNASLWNVKTGTPFRLPMMNNGIKYNAQFNHDRTMILTWDSTTARLWDAGTWKQIGESIVHNFKRKNVVFNQDGTRIITWDEEGRIPLLWDASTGKQIGEPLKAVYDEDITGAVFNHDGTKILTWCSIRGILRLWEAGTGSQIPPPIILDMEENYVRSAVFNRDETKILTWSELESGDEERSAVCLWNVATGKKIGEPIKLNTIFFDALFNSDETMIITLGYDKIRRWDAITHKEIGEPINMEPALYEENFYRQGTIFLIWHGDTVWLWDVSTEKPVGQTLKNDSDYKYNIKNARFAPDGIRILTWSDDGTARLWEAGTGKKVCEPLSLKVWVRWIKGMVFTRDAARILTWADDKTAHLWKSLPCNPIAPIPPISSTARKDRYSRSKVDYDFPVNLLKLQVAALTGIEFDLSSKEIKYIEPERFEKIKAEYLKKAAEHYKSCKYKPVNIFRRFYPSLCPL